MSVFETIFLMAATAVLLLSLSGAHVRGTIWVLAIAFDAVISDAYSNAGLPFPEAFMAGCDFFVCVALYYIAAHRWELWLFLIMQFSMLVSIVYLANEVWAPGWIGEDTYLTVLEFVNYAAILLVGGVSGFVIADRQDGIAFRPWHRVLYFDRLLRRSGEKD